MNFRLDGGSGDPIEVSPNESILNSSYPGIFVYSKMNSINEKWKINNPIRTLYIIEMTPCKMAM